MVKDKALEKALTAMRRGALLVHQHGNGERAARFEIWLPRQSFRVSDAIADVLLQRPDVQPYDSGLFPGCPQSWKLEQAGSTWRTWARR